MRRSPLGRLAALAAVAVPLALLARATWSNFRQASAPCARPAGPIGAPRNPAAGARPKPGRLGEMARARCLAHLDRADAEARQALDRRIRRLDAFFADAGRRAPLFAGRALGPEGKWRLVADHLPGASGDSHGAFVARAFREVVLSPGRVEAEARRAALGYLDDLRGIEGRMLVAIRRDVADLPGAPPSHLMDEKLLRESIEGAAAEAAGHAGAGLRDDVARGLVALAVGEAVAQAAVRVGTSAGVLGAGVASGAATFGVGLAAGLVADRLVSSAWDRWSDPRGELARAVAARVDELRRVVVDGTTSAPGLRPQLERWSRGRAEARRAAVLGPNSREVVKP